MSMPKILPGFLGLFLIVWPAQAADEGLILHNTAPNDSQATTYAQNLDYTISIMVDEYIRPVSREDLLFAALSGLYEAANVPVPKTLKTEIVAAKADSARVKLLYDIRTQLGKSESLQGNTALVASINAMCKTLDPYTSLINSDELARANQVETNHGLGLEFLEYEPDRPLKIKNVSPGSPAQRAGIRPGDVITRINDHIPDVKALMELNIIKYSHPGNGFPIDAPFPTGNPLELSLERPSSKTTWKTKLTPSPFRPETAWGVNRNSDNSWDYMLDLEKQIALVRLGSLGYGTSEELEAVLTELHGQGVRGLILDLRWNPGGFLDEAVATARLFLGEQPIARIKGRKGTIREYAGKLDVNFLNLPMIVLVNGETSGGAELIAAALQDNHRAQVAGQRTLGKASVQSTKALRVPIMVLKLTSGTFVRPSGKNLHRFPDSHRTDDWGVLPDPKLEYRVSPDLNRQLREWYQWQTLRPGQSTEALPLDDPAADPQRYAAWMALVEKMKKTPSSAN
jgi:carboxyl-terminal processing protease